MDIPLDKSELDKAIENNWKMTAAYALSQMDVFDWNIRKNNPNIWKPEHYKNVHFIYSFPLKQCHVKRYAQCILCIQMQQKLPEM